MCQEYTCSWTWHYTAGEWLAECLGHSPGKKFRCYPFIRLVDPWADGSGCSDDEKKNLPLLRIWCWAVISLIELSRVKGSHLAFTTVLFGKHLCSGTLAECLLSHCGHHLTCRMVRNVHSQVTCILDIISKHKLVIVLTCVPFNNSRWKTDEWPISVQLHHSHDVGSIYKWHVCHIYEV
jgi:hypothetical protein